MLRLLFFFLILSFYPCHLLAAEGKAPTSVTQKAEDWPVDSVLRMAVDSSINPATLNYLESGFEKAEKDNVGLVLITLNTPGGLVSTTKRIMAMIGEASMPTAIWVSPEGASATSAGAIIASSAHILVMSEGTNIGAATPITMGGDLEENDGKAKAVNDLVALVTSLSETRGRNGDLFARMISDAASYSSAESLSNNLIDGVVSTEKELFSFLNGRKIHLKGKNLSLKVDRPQVVFHEMDLGQRLLNILADPNMAYVLFLIGAALLYLELQAPGGMIAGAIGAVCLVFAGIGFQVLPLNFGALGLIVLSFLLFVLEAFITSYGMLTLAGMTALIAGSLFLFRTDDAYIALSRGLIFSACGAIGLFVTFLLLFWIKDARKQQHSEDVYSLKGKAGVVLSCLGEVEGEYRYQVRVNGEIWRARSSKRFQEGDVCPVESQAEGEEMVLLI